MFTEFNKEAGHYNGTENVNPARLGLYYWPRLYVILALGAV